MRTIIGIFWFLTESCLWAGSIGGPLALLSELASCGPPVHTTYDRVAPLGVYFLFSLVGLSYTLYFRRRIGSHPRLKYAYIVLVLGLPCGVASPAIACLTSAALIGLCWWHEARRIPPGHCQICRYNLTGNVSGRCPECGTPLSEALQPQTGPRSDVGAALLRHKPIAARVLVGLCIVGAFAAVYQYTEWPRLMPTGWLLRLEPVLPMYGIVELWSRFNTAGMTPAEARRFFSSNMRVAVSAPSRQSAARGVDLAILLEGRVPPQVGFADIAECALLVDGEPVQAPETRGDGRQGAAGDPWYQIVWTRHFRIDGLAPGARQFRLLANVGFGSACGSRTVGPISRSPYGWLIDETVVVDVSE